MTPDGRFSWEDFDAVVRSGFNGVSLPDTIDMAKAMMADPTFDDGSTPVLGDVDPIQFFGSVIADYTDATAQEYADSALLSAEYQRQKVDKQVLDGVQAVLGLTPEEFNYARENYAAGDGALMRSIYADYLERS